MELSNELLVKTVSVYKLKVHLSQSLFAVIVSSAFFFKHLEYNIYKTALRIIIWQYNYVMNMHPSWENHLEKLYL